MKDLVQDFHRAARVMNPEYKDTGVLRDNTLTGAFLRVIKSMLHDDPKKNEKVQKIIAQELPIFTDRRGELHMDDAIVEAAGTMLPHEWWTNYGTDYPTLQPLAIRLLSQPLGSGDSERNWRDWDLVKTQQRCSLASVKADKLVHVYCSKKLNDASHAGAYQKLMKDWADMNDKLGIRGDDYELNHKREFHAFLEDWEATAVQSKDSNSHRRLEKKYKGLYIFDMI